LAKSRCETAGHLARWAAQIDFRAEIVALFGALPCALDDLGKLEAERNATWCDLPGVPDSRFSLTIHAVHHEGLLYVCMYINTARTGIASSPEIFGTSGDAPFFDGCGEFAVLAFWTFGVTFHSLMQSYRLVWYFGGRGSALPERRVRPLRPPSVLFPLTISTQSSATHTGSE
jgi:hypothetical protein